MAKKFSGLKDYLSKTDDFNCEKIFCNMVTHEWVLFSQVQILYQEVHFDILLKRVFILVAYRNINFPIENDPIFLKL